MQKLLLPTTLSNQGDSDKHKQSSHKQHTLLLWLKQEAKRKQKIIKKIKNFTQKKDAKKKWPQRTKWDDSQIYDAL